MRVGIVSFAHVHARGLTAKARDAGAELIGIFDDNPKRGMQAAEAYGIPFFPTLEALIEQRPAAIVNESENSKHAEFAVPCLKAGIHVLCEKPLETNVTRMDAMIAAAKGAKVNLMTAFPMPFVPSVRKALEIVRSGDVGRVIAVSGTNRGRSPGGWYVDPELSGGGAVIDRTVHVADLMRRVLQAEPELVYCEADTLFSDAPTYDAGVLSIRWSGEAFSVLDCSWSLPEGYRIWGDVTLNIVGTLGILTVDVFGQQKLWVHNGSAKHVRYVSIGDDYDFLMVKHFLECCEEGKAVEITGEDGKVAAQIALAAIRSARSHRLEAIQ
jgi:UDP-N-acetylglucosamine 3-dehydrogenase